MPLRTDWSREQCFIARGLNVLGDPWLLLILRELFVGNTRFDGLRARLGVADNILSSRLQQLVSHGVVERVPYSGGVRRRHEYSLTAAGRDALPILHAVMNWSSKHTLAPNGETIQVVCTRCGETSESALWCARCQITLDVESTAWEASWAPSPVALADCSPNMVVGPV